MARPTQDIKQIMLDAIASDIVLSELNSTSQTAIYNLFCFLVAQNINFFEQRLDIFKAEIEQIILQTDSGNGFWWYNKLLSFQYGDVLQLINNVYNYPIIDPSKRIVTRASISQSNDIKDRTVNIKLAKGLTQDTLIALTAEELSAVKDYVDKIKISGTSTNVISLNADRIKISANVYYIGQYTESVVKENVKIAINNYLANITFNGEILLSKIVDAIQSVEGVYDVTLGDVKGRAEQDSLSSSSAITITKDYLTKAGYIITEDTAGFTLNDTITMILK